MTVPVASDSNRVLTARLATLRAERDVLLAEARTDNRGDAADQATNVEALIRLQLLDERIATVELEIAESHHREHVDGVVSVGDVVTLDLGDGDETYVVGSVEQAVAGVDTITPGSPLGQAIVGAEVGSTVTYEPRRGVSLDVVIRSAGELLPASA
ncbi:GreA/GreB family elongation factor [Nocardioides sp.]|uniref:GreA/GreB family elongation factor n=1 Tax=Nocardioides sp. TaxID=35761 RepID=UPI001A337471|nr:GreA/GreB family elongation factor [Nocardioides sp.]MBJ7356087.1 GreA/GreB family elongation factor [Nocardioides sp.]